MTACRIDGCDRRVVARGLCESHYRKARRRGLSVLPRQLMCQLDDCTAKHYMKGYCRKHYERWNKHGDPYKLGDPGAPTREILSYQGAHLRVYRSRGKASDQVCIDCRNAAAEWSLPWDAPNVLIGPLADGTGREGRYSTDPGCYEPRCRPCHRIYDQHAVQEASAS